MGNEIENKKNQVFIKIIFYLRISVLVNFLLVIPLIVLSVVAIGGNITFIFTIVFVAILCVQFLALIILDIFRIYKSKKMRIANE